MTTTEIVKTVREAIPAEQLEEATRSLTLADAMRAGAAATTQVGNWGSGGNACALSAARLGAQATGWIAGA